MNPLTSSHPRGPRHHAAFQANFRPIAKARLIALLTAIVTLFVAVPAWASAPMCGEHAESIAAPLPLRRTEPGEIRATPDCEPVKHGAQGLPNTPGPDVIRFLLGDGAVALRQRAPLCPRTGWLSIDPFDHGADRVGFERGIDRPPQS